MQPTIHLSHYRSYSMYPPSLITPSIPTSTPFFPPYIHTPINPAFPSPHPSLHPSSYPSRMESEWRDGESNEYFLWVERWGRWRYQTSNHHPTHPSLLYSCCYQTVHLPVLPTIHPNFSISIFPSLPSSMPPISPPLPTILSTV